MLNNSTAHPVDSPDPGSAGFQPVSAALDRGMAISLNQHGMADNPPLCRGQTVTRPLFDEPMKVETVEANGRESWTVGLVGSKSEKFRRVILTAADLQALRLQEATATAAWPSHSTPSSRT